MAGTKTRCLYHLATAHNPVEPKAPGPVAFASYPQRAASSISLPRRAEADPTLLWPSTGEDAQTLFDHHCRNPHCEAVTRSPSSA